MPRAWPGRSCATPSTWTSCPPWPGRTGSSAAPAVLGDPDPHAGETYDLTGPWALGLEEVAGILTAATGRVTRYQEESLEEAYGSRRAFGVPDWQMEAWVSTYTAIAAGELDVVTDAVERLTGAPTLDLETLLRR